MVRTFDAITNLISHLIGAFADTPIPTPFRRFIIGTFSRCIRANVDEVLLPFEAFRSCGDYFARALRPGARPVASQASVVSPADGVVREVCSVNTFTAHGQPDSRLLIKRVVYSISGLLGIEHTKEDSTLTYKDGSLAVIYLAPHNYHRVHVPVTGTIERVRRVCGPLWPVNEWGIKNIPNLFGVNERLVFEGRCEHADAHGNTQQGRWALVMVGATNVGRMTISALPAQDTAPLNVKTGRLNAEITGSWSVQQGDELGCFRLGSTVVLITSFPLADGPGLQGGEERADTGSYPILCGQELVAISE